jgi:hypothetical protein
MISDMVLTAISSKKYDGLVGGLVWLDGVLLFVDSDIVGRLSVEKWMVSVGLML